MFPFESLGTTHRELGLLVALLIGLGFGFVLERAGFGTAKKLSAQFYLYDMTVFKVMFSAIVTAMLGVTVLGATGVVNASAIITGGASETFVWPMLAGGFVLGLGFILSGYCPGTSLVASASGKFDGMATFGGVVIGSLIFGALYPVVEGFAKSGALGQRFLDQVTGIPRPVLALAVALMALGMFIGAEKVEAIVRNKRGMDEAEDKIDASPAHTVRKYVFSGLAGVGVLAVATLAIPGSSQAVVTATTPEAQPVSAVKNMSPAVLARRLVEAPWKMRILDLRDAKTCEKKSVPNAECTPAASLKGMNLDAATPTRDLVLVGADAKAQVPKAALLYRGRIFRLEGGYAGWKAYALTAPKAPGVKATAEEWAAYRFRAAVHRAMTGRKTAPAVRAPKAFVPRRRKKRKGGCS